jgi:DNA-directed RNA polymerase specialized sigma24 family protein
VTEVAGRYGVSGQSVHTRLQRCVDELRGDLERFTFLLGGSDGEQLFGA